MKTVQAFHWFHFCAFLAIVTVKYTSCITPDLFSACIYRTGQTYIFYTFAQPDLGKCHNHMIKMKLYSVYMYDITCLELILKIQIYHGISDCRIRHDKRLPVQCSYI